MFFLFVQQISRSPKKCSKVCSKASLCAKTASSQQELADSLMILCLRKVMVLYNKNMIFSNYSGF